MRYVAGERPLTAEPIATARLFEFDHVGPKAGEHSRAVAGGRALARIDDA
jgi:hypothetical protein